MHLNFFKLAIAQSRGLTPILHHYNKHFIKRIFFVSNHHALNPQHAADIIQQQVPDDFKATLAIILGSGLGPLAEEIEAVAIIAYADIPGFHVSTVHGHQGRLILGYWHGLSVVCLQGRAHFYEGASVQALQIMIRTLKCLGCTQVLITNAAGSLRAEVGPGELMLVTDHINFQGINPLVGPNASEFGERFVPMDNAYDRDLRARCQEVATLAGQSVAEGVYMGVLGPTFETPAEIRAFRVLGADAVGMSTVAEVILARHAGMKVLCISTITNLAAGMDEASLSHAETLLQATGATAKLVNLLGLYVQSLVQRPL